MRQRPKALLEVFTGRDKAGAATAEARWNAFADRIELACVLAGAASMLGRPAQALEAGLVAAMVGGRRLARSAARLVADPPRPDFVRRTVVRTRPLDPTVFDESEIDRMGGQLAFALSAGANYIQALVRAGERAAGAVEANQLGFARERLRESGQYALQGSETIDIAEVLEQDLEGQLRHRLGVSVDRDAEMRERRPMRLDEQLGEHTMALLFKAGVRIQELRHLVDARPPRVRELQERTYPLLEDVDLTEQLRVMSDRFLEQADLL